MHKGVEQYREHFWTNTMPPQQVRAMKEAVLHCKRFGCDAEVKRVWDYGEKKPMRLDMHECCTPLSGYTFSLLGGGIGMGTIIFLGIAAAAAFYIWDWGFSN